MIICAHFHLEDRRQVYRCKHVFFSYQWKTGTLKNFELNVSQFAAGDLIVPVFEENPVETRT